MLLENSYYAFCIITINIINYIKHLKMYKYIETLIKLTIITNQ